MNRRNLVAGLTVVTALVTVAAVGVSLMDADDERPTTITTTIPDAGSLEPGNEVRAAGVIVGQIRDIELEEGLAKVTLEVDPGVLPIHDDASLKVRPVNLLGENYVDLDPGSDSSPFLDDAVIPAERTEAAVTLQDVLGTFEAPTAASLAAVVTTLGEGLHGNGQRTARAIEALLPAMENAERLGRLLGDQNDVLANLIATVDPVAAALAADGGTTLDRLVDSTTNTLGALTAQQTALEQTLVQLPATLTSAQRTLAQFGGVAREATPTLRALRPLTGDLDQVVDELQAFADSADPALASLEPVLARADQLLDQAAPVVAQLRQAGPDLASAARSLRPVSRELLDENLFGVMEFVRKWALSTNGRDGLSHYFRGVLYLTPDSLQSIITSLIPSQIDLDQGDGAGQGPPDLDLPGHLPDLDLGLDHLTGGLLPDIVNGLLNGLNLNRVSGSTPPVSGRAPAEGTAAGALDPTSALGLTTHQEQALLGQLLGGDQ